MASYQLASSYKIRDQLNHHGAIPVAYQSVLEERLVLVCTELKRQERSRAPRPAGEIRAQHFRRKKTRQDYLGVLGEDPHIFLPFLLAIDTDRSGCEFDLPRFREQHVGRKTALRLSEAARTVLEVS